MANVMDLLFSWRRTVRVNDNISSLYMLYQALIFASSILGPATIVLMLTGAFVSVLNVSATWGYILGVAPPVLYLIICFLVKADTQIYIAYLATGFYAVVMVAVLIGTIVEIVGEGLFGPSGIFFVLVAGITIVSGLLHPQEFWDLPSGLLYFLAIPSGYLLLTIFMLTNMHNVSWGTREVAKAKPKKKPEGEEVGAPTVIAAKPKQENFFVNLIDRQLEEDSVCGKMTQFFQQCCGKTHELAIYDMVKKMNDKLEEMEKAAVADIYDNQALYAAPPSEIYGRKAPSHHSGGIYGSVTSRIPGVTPELPEDDEAIDQYYQMVHRDDMINPYWLEEDCLRGSEVQLLDQEEVTFWKKFIKKYLMPIDKDEAKERKIANDLKEMRNNVCLGYFMLNALWLAVMFILALSAEDLGSLYISYGVKGNQIEIEPFGLVFLSIFAVTLTIQFFCMLWHRWGTLRHIMASTIIDFIPGVNTINIAKKDESAIIHQARKAAKEIARLEPDTPPESHLSAGPMSPTSMHGSADNDAGFHRRHTTRISIRDRFKKNLAKVITEANSEEPVETNMEEGIQLEPPPLPRRGKFAKVNRAHTVRQVKRLQSIKKHSAAGEENGAANSGV